MNGLADVQRNEGEWAVFHNETCARKRSENLHGLARSNRCEHTIVGAESPKIQVDGSFFRFFSSFGLSQNVFGRKEIL